ncbi:cytochrome c3 family protein [Campylobacter sp. RM9344]|uniref:Cytochrome c3 family protein n=1 Tax=Campylobacter californiensis TaxID=1032243 RepID=A0AAW3ZY49_9BACT|nr:MULTISPECIES: cytochrome c3 family protein [unclassified Campylobacter]MBE2985380.1 cytochrome c3 family protein [Campylobacter sp. RM6883]MBE2987171.1 cytochrome c3 family protein [Campylobacter sp. RM12919]MBE2987666.1 cytochrome c3 family protein [Campylobacter sp. RM12920]MBE2995960.1 cytochrome c3 family protein [Campylobacter sp. RM6913]MBE3029291.1 cytochrome c3 family protein [Campylobacter sp. RM9344]
MRKILFILSILIISLSAADVNASLSEMLRNSKGEITTDFSPKIFPIQGIHKKLNLACIDCHKDEKQKDYSSAMNNSCLSCHGSYSKLGETTGHLGHNDNIHANPHYESLDCDTCHKSHQPSVNMCLRCHTQDSMKKLIVK